MKQKLSLERYRLTSIRTQIILGFGLILGLTFIIVVINLASLRNLQTSIETTVDEASRVRELSQEFQNQFLLARQEEKAFLDNWRNLGFETAANTHVSANQIHIAQARQSLDELRELIEDNPTIQFEHVVDEVALLGPALDGYESTFLETVERIGERSQAGGYELRLQNAKSDLENLASTIPNSIELNRTVVQMDASEQAFFSSGKHEHVDKTHLLALNAKDLLNSTPHLDWAYSDRTRPLLLSMLDERMDAFDELVQLEQEISTNTVVFQETTKDINALTDHIGVEAAKSLAKARGDLGSAVVNSTILSVVVGLVALAIGVLIAWLLGRRILRPLSELTDAAQDIGEGNFNVTVAISGQDEFASLGNAFNQMAGQLRNLIDSLERLVAERTQALATSFQVSRRLSTILDQQQLVAEVVEQVRSAFEYYHVHIYLFDERTTHLVMAGGTGEAGRAMLAARHKLEQGQGLVGKAAETRQPILVPDVQKEPSWLPNPLLPVTRSEIAVPIMLGDQVKGVLDVQHDVRDGLDQNDVELLQTIANQMAVALQNAQLYQEAQSAAEREATVNAINQRIQQAGTIEDVLQVAAKELGLAFRAGRTAVQLSTTTWHDTAPWSGERIGSERLEDEGFEDERLEDEGPNIKRPRNNQAKNGHSPRVIE